MKLSIVIYLFSFIRRLLDSCELVHLLYDSLFRDLKQCPFIPENQTRLHVIIFAFEYYSGNSTRDFQYSMECLDRGSAHVQSRVHVYYVNCIRRVVMSSSVGHMLSVVSFELTGVLWFWKLPMGPNDPKVNASSSVGKFLCGWTQVKTTLVLELSGAAYRVVPFRVYADQKSTKF